jgi:hypothetical protein
MASLRIPSRYYKAINLLLRLNEEETLQLVKAINGTPPLITKKDVCSHIEQQLPHLNDDELSQIIDFLISVNDFKVHSGLTNEEAVVQLSNALIDEELQLSDGKTLEEIHSRISVFLDAKGQINLISKIRSVYSEHEKIFVDSRILTDVRPVFDEDITLIPAALIVHTLKLDYIQDDEKKTFFVALDDEDIENLRQDLTRAEKKAKLIRNEIKSTRIKFVEQQKKEED